VSLCGVVVDLAVSYLVHRQQRLAKEGEKAARAAEKAAEDALVKAKQQALEEEQKKKREDERVKRETARKAQEEEKQRKDEERRKRQAEEKERQAELERKRKEREDKLKQERREKEERDRKVKEEREAKERAAATARREQQEKEELEKKAREEKEKAERERLEKETEARAAQQSRKPSVRPPPSPRNATASGSTQRPPPPQTTPKKILNKPAPTNVISPVPAVPRQNSQSRPVIVTNQPVPQTPTQPSNPPTPGYSPGVNGSLPQQHPLVSPRVPFNPAPQFNGFVPGPAIPQQGPGPILGPSALPRNFGAPGFDSSYPARPIGAPAIVSPGPIGPPQKTNPNPPPSSMLAPGSGRRQSIIADPGPIGPPRPIQPIARPTEQSGSGSASPVRRSPSPNKILGSSALATDDDEVLQTSRRTTANGPVWGAAPAPPRPPVDLRGPWGPPPPGFPIQPQNLPRPPVGPSPWGTASPNDQWHPSNFFPPGQFVGHNPSPPPHSGN
jgi:hypothetical protein